MQGSANKALYSAGLEYHFEFATLNTGNKILIPPNTSLMPGHSFYTQHATSYVHLGHGVHIHEGLKFGHSYTHTVLLKVYVWQPTPN